MRYGALLPVLLCVACARDPHPGFTHMGDAVYLKLHALGDVDAPLADGDSVLLRFRAALPGTAPGSFASSERWYAVADLRQGALARVLPRLMPGDSASVIAPGTAWPWARLLPNGGDEPPPDELQVELALMDHRGAALIAIRRVEQRLADPEGYEQRLIARALEEGAWTRWGTSALHYRITGAAVDTQRVRPGDLVSVEWEGSRIEDGKVFDATARNGQPFSYRFGDPDQVVEGVAVAISLLCEGQEGEFIVPSALAFGGRGIPGLLEGHTPVRYTLRLLRVERGSIPRSS